MSDYRDGVHCRIDPEQAELLADGSVAQEVSVIMTDDHRFDGRRGRHWRPPAICTLTPTEAREMAFELLCAAEHAERAGAGL
jgi:hypothetical protein